MQTKEFYTDDFALSDKIYASVYLRMDKRYDIQMREVYSISGLLGDFGGLSGALSTGSQILVWFLLQKFLYASIATKIYRTEKKESKVSEREIIDESLESTTRKVNPSSSTSRSVSKKGRQVNGGGSKS